MAQDISARELHARLCLHATPQIGPQRFQLLLNHFSSAEAALAASTSAWLQLGLPEQCKTLSQGNEVLQKAEAALKWAENPLHHLILHDSLDYPALLSETHAAPTVLFVEGNPKALAMPQLAIVGSRNANPTNKQTAYHFAKTLAAAGCAITSGLASGIDTAAHQGALKAGGCTLAVVGTGLWHTYPKSNHALREQIAQSSGALVSEFCLDVSPVAANFPKRNRIISGLSLGVLVVEAGLASGSLITARYAAEQNRDVFAIPGSIHYPGSKGCHQLLRDGAVLVECVQDILGAWQHWLSTPIHDSEPKPAETAPCALLALLQGKPMNNDELAQQLQLGMPNVLQQLTELELDGKIYTKAGLWHYLPENLS